MYKMHCFIACTHTDTEIKAAFTHMRRFVGGVSALHHQETKQNQNDVPLREKGHKQVFYKTVLLLLLLLL